MMRQENIVRENKTIKARRGLRRYIAKNRVKLGIVGITFHNSYGTEISDLVGLFINIRVDGTFFGFIENMGGRINMDIADFITIKKLLK